MSDVEEANDFVQPAPLPNASYKGEKFALTWNNYTEENRDSLIAWIKENCTHGIVARENAGTPHLQCAFITRARKTFASLKRVFPQAHLTSQRKSYLANFRYCSKQDEEPFVHGSRPNVAITAGSRTDAQRAHEFILSANSWQEVLLNVENVKYISSHVQWARQIYDARPFEYPVLPSRLFKWQQDLVEELETTPHPRKIIWYFDNVGNHGKSTLTTLLMKEKKAVSLPNKNAEACRMLTDRPKIILFDFARVEMERIQYGLIEHCKNGRLISTKYDPLPRIFPTPHVVIFANFEPDRNAWSQDRYDVRSNFDMNITEAAEVIEVPDDISDYVPTPPSSPRVLETPPQTPVAFRRQNAFCEETPLPIRKRKTRNELESEEEEL
ncbi:rep protein [Circoviridae sp.]|nr:rep protein [Circoviridae sp.]